VTRPVVELELGEDPQIAKDLEAGGVFVPGCVLALDTECDLVVRGAAGELTIAARTVWLDGTRGAGLQLVGCDAEMKRKIAELAVVPEEPERKIPANVQERLRGLTLVQQIKVAQHGEAHERIVLERIYGKTVWEALLRNPRVTGPEVARIARMGSLPRTMIELIVANGAWLQIPEIRRALLSNPRLGVDQILRILRLLPKHELKLAAIQTAYPHAVRDAARRMLREGG
jgi:hypothetical protein